MSRLSHLLNVDYIPGMRKRRPFRWGLGALIVTAIIVIVGISHWSPFSSYAKTYKANFAYSLHVYPHTPVRINGDDVGYVTDSKLIGPSEIQLSYTITDSQVTVHPNASSQLYYRTLLGRNLYVALDTGSGTGTLSAPIPESRDGAQVEVDQVLMPLQTEARLGVQQTIHELGRGLDAGNAPRESIQRAGGALDNTGTAVSAIRGQNPGYDIPRLVAKGNTVFSALNTNENDLIGLINNANTALAVTAARSDDVDSILAQAPSTLAQTQSEMVALRQTEDVLNPLAVRLQPGVKQITPAVAVATPTLDEVDRLVPIADPTLRQLNPAVVSLGQLGRAGVPLVTGLNPTLDRTNASILPWLGQTSSVTGLKNYEAIGPTFATVSSSASDYDSGGFMQRFQPGLKTGLTQLPFASSQCSSLLAGTPGGTQACETLVSDINQVLASTASSTEGARR